MLTIPGLRRLHSRPHPQLRPAPPPNLPLSPILAQHLHNSRQPSANVPSLLAPLHLPHSLPPHPNHPPRHAHRPITNNILRAPLPHIPLLRNTPPLNALLHNHLPPLHPHGLPHSHEILRRILRPLLPRQIQEIPRLPSWGIQRACQKNHKNIGLPDRRYWNKLGFHLPLPISPSPHFPALRTLVPWRLLRWALGLRRPKRWKGAFLVQCAIEYR